MRLIEEHFPRLSEIAVAVAGHQIAVATVGVMTVGWTSVGIAAGFPTWWFLSADTVGTVTTVLILLLVQHSQSRDMQLCR
ncbi:low affinity iron permease family protein [Rhizobium sp. BK251]|uniref:low affinity iron permease family protein n=1 Tax=Rhizobium sp. BK251 TaxID=2512125 RepID=UPI0010D19D5E|nr:low affinity iron permease family protein [Rhizobium sp. BK251]TCL63277.1 low affinity iron permease [Rhizobium sp. BK251]